MDLEGQDSERGYAMAALLVSLAVMSVLMTAALPAWRHAAQREKEAELVFRGEQYARAVALFRSKNANAFPASVDVLVQGKYLRKKYLDPVTNKEFDVIGAATQNPVPGQPPLGGRQGGPVAGRGGPAAQPPAGFTSTVSGGIMGVHSKSQETSIRIYKGQTRYDQWNFVFTAANRPGGTAPGALNPGGPGGAQMPGPGGRGTNPAGRGGAGRGSGAGRQGGFGLPPPPVIPR
jgi:type II secretory pathway pseudopilin PulG